jgi:hypothetical protein
MLSDYTAKDAARFWSKVDLTLVDVEFACLEWKGTLEGGYGRLIWNRSLQLAHRISFMLAFGHYPAELKVLHHCDNPSCVNPNHLFLGTLLDNARDRKDKGRNGLLKGERNGRAKLTRAQVDEIRQRYNIGDVSYSMLAAEYGVSSGLISHIIAKRQWRD